MSDRLPSEVWMQIFALACLDSGVTGRHLSLVCRQFHDCSKPYKLQSIALKRGKHIIAFHRHIAQLPPQEKRVKFLLVRCPNLFLDVSDDEEDMDFQDDDAMSLDTSVKSSDSNGSIVDMEMSPDEIGDIVADANVDYPDVHSPMEGVQSAVDAEIGAADTLVLEAFRGIMEDISSTLTLLYVHWVSMAPLLIEDFLIPLPHLEELSLLRVWTSEDETAPESDDPPPLLFPKLKYYSWWGYYEERCTSLREQIEHMAPNVTDFRLSLGQINPPPENLRLPESVERLIILWTEERMPAAHAHFKQVVFGPELAGSRTVKFVDSHANKGELDEEDWVAEWLERVAGGPGPW